MVLQFAFWFALLYTQQTIKLGTQQTLIVLTRIQQTSDYGH